MAGFAAVSHCISARPTRLAVQLFGICTRERRTNVKSLRARSRTDRIVDRRMLYSTKRQEDPRRITRRLFEWERRHLAGDGSVTARPKSAALARGAERAPSRLPHQARRRALARESLRTRARRRDPVRWRTVQLRAARWCRGTDRELETSRPRLDTSGARRTQGFSREGRGGDALVRSARWRFVRRARKRSGS